jgi:hypothetical protein
MKFENISVYNFNNAIRGMRNPKNSWHLSDSEFGMAHFEEIDEIAYDVADKWIQAEYPDNQPDNYEDLLEEKYEWLLKNGIIEVDEDYCTFAFIGPKDMGLAQALIRGGSEHRKFMRQIFVSVDITAPLYWWKEFDTYKVGTTANSTSTMHKMASKPITLDCFDVDDYCPDILTSAEEVDYLIQFLEGLRLKHLEYLEMAKDKNLDKSEKDALNAKAKKYWKELIRWLPEGWLQTRTVTMDYENFLAMCSKGQRRFHKLNEWSGQDDATLPNFIAMSRTLPYAQDFIFLDELN